MRIPVLPVLAIVTAQAYGVDAQALSVEIQDYRFSNGVIGKLVTYTMAEREP